MTGSIAAVREIWADRDQARSRVDALYLLYVSVLGVVVLVVPALVQAGRVLARPDVLPALLAAGMPQILTAVLCAAAAAMVAVGAVRGPALLAPFFTATLASSGLPRRRVLWRPFLRAVLAPVTATTTAAGLIAVTLANGGHATGAEGVVFVAGSLGAGLLLAAAWLLGELLGSAARRMLTVVLLVLAALVSMSPVPVLLGAAYPAAASGSGAVWAGGLLAAVWAGGLLAAGSAAVAGCVPLLDRLRGRVLVEQASRWEQATTIATTGDLTTAAGTYRTRPTTGRRLPAVGGGALPVLYLRRDVMAWLRTPERSLTGLLLTIAGAAALTGGAVLTGPLAWVSLLSGSLGLWMASGAFVDGIRHAVHTLGSPPLLGQTAAVQAVLHAIAPLLLLAVVAALTTVATVVLTGAEPVLALTAAPTAVLLTTVLVVGRVRDSAKGPMPLALTTPMPTPQGDASVIPMLLWQSDAILLALVAGTVLVLAGGLGPLWLAGAALALVAVVAAMAHGRLRELSS